MSDVQNARGFIGALKKFSALQEPPAFIADEGRVASGR